MDNNIERDKEEVEAKASTTIELLVNTMTNLDIVSK